MFITNMLGVKRCYWGFWKCPFYHLLIQFCGIFYWIFPSVGVGCLCCHCHTILDFSRLSISSQYVIHAIQPGGWLLLLKFLSTIVFIVYLCLFIDISIITVIHVIHVQVCLQTPFDVYQNMFSFKFCFNDPMFYLLWLSIRGSLYINLKKIFLLNRTARNKGLHNSRLYHKDCAKADR